MDDKRIRSSKYLEERVLFDGMIYCVRGKEIVPIMDVDAIMDAVGKAWVIFECKHGNSMPPIGQKITLERLVKDISSKDKPAVVFVCSHNVPEGEKVYLKDCIVTSIYTNGIWIDPIKEYGKGYTVKALTDSFLQKNAPEMLIW